jgi:hypothetical protein
MLDFHKHVNVDGEVLILRRIPRSRVTDGNGKGNPFHWPEGVGSVVECTDWNPAPKCGHGLHGWPWGWGLGEGCEYDIIDDIWLVIGCKPEDVVGELDGGCKCKFHLGTIRLEGKFADAINAVKGGHADCVRKSAKESGDSSRQSQSGDSSRQDANGRDCCCAAAAKNCRVRVGYRGAFALAYWDDADGWRFLVGKVGENGIMAGVWYEVRAGKIEPCLEQK